MRSAEQSRSCLWSHPLVMRIWVVHAHTQALNFPQLLIRLSWFSPQAKLWLAIATAMRHIMTAICGCKGRKREKKTKTWTSYSFCERQSRKYLRVKGWVNRVNEEWRKNTWKDRQTDRPQNSLCCFFFFTMLFARHQNISMRLHIMTDVWIKNLSKLTQKVVWVKITNWDEAASHTMYSFP